MIAHKLKFRSADWLIWKEMQTWSEKSQDLLIFQIQIDVIDAGSGGQSRHGAHGSNQRVEEPCPHGRPDVPDGYFEPRGRPLLGRVGWERQVGLGHADGQVAEPLLGVTLDFGLGFFRHLNPVRPVYLLGNGLNLGGDREVQVVQEFEVWWLAEWNSQ